MPNPTTTSTTGEEDETFTGIILSLIFAYRADEIVEWPESHSFSLLVW